MTTSITIKIERISSDTVRWTVNANTTRSDLFVEFTLGSIKVTSYFGQQNVYGTGGDHYTVGNVDFHGFAQGKDGAMVEQAQVRGTMVASQNMLTAGDQV